MTAVEGESVACFVVRLLETLQYLNRGRDITSLFYPPWVGGQRAREFLSESVGFCPVCVAEIKVLAVASAGYPHILRRCGPDLVVGATRSADFLNPRCGWSERDLSIKTAPGGSDVERIKLH